MATTFFEFEKGKRKLGSFEEKEHWLRDKRIYDFYLEDALKQEVLWRVYDSKKRRQGPRGA